MKAVLEFELPEERSEFMLAVRGWEYSVALFDFDQLLRAVVKYGTEEEKLIPGIEWARGKLWEILNESGIDPLED